MQPVRRIWRVGMCFVTCVLCAALLARLQQTAKYRPEQRVPIEQIVTEKKNDLVESGVRVFLHDGLRTDTTQASIPLSMVIDGGPGKDGIPALHNPLYVPIDSVL